MEVLSPELVLVDQQLAAAARSALAGPPDVFEALERARAGDTVRKLRVSFNAQETAAEADVARRRPGFRRLFVAVAIGTTVAVAATASAVVTLGRDEVTTARALASKAPATTHRHAVASGAVPKQPRPTRTAVKRQPPPAAKPKPEPARRPHPAAARQSGPVPSPPEPDAAKPKPARKAAAPTSKPAPGVGTAAVRPQPAPVLTWPIRRQATYYRVQVYRVTRKPEFLFEVWTDKTRLAVPATWGNAGEHNRLTPGVYRWAAYPTFGALGEVGLDTASTQPVLSGRFTV